jgi:hypothetical protein
MRPGDQKITSVISVAEKATHGVPVADLVARVEGLREIPRSRSPESPKWSQAEFHTCFGTWLANTRRMTLCPRSAVGPNINGHPPSITVIPWSRP